MLVSCNECGREISDTAESCPHCGAKVIKEKAEDRVNNQDIPFSNQVNGVKGSKNKKIICLGSLLVS